MKNHRLSRKPLSAALLLALTPPAFAADFIFSSGVYQPGVTAPEPLLAGDVLQINSGGNKFFSGVTLTNQSGLVNWNVDTLFMQNGALIDNRSLWDAKSDNSLVNNGGPLSTFNNSGTFRKSGGAGATTIGSIAFINTGIVDAQTGTINFAGGNATFNAGTQFTGAGATLISNNASFNGAISSSNLVLSNGSFNGGGVALSGTVDMTGGLLIGGWTLNAGQTLNARDGNNKFMSSATFTNLGNVQWQSGNSLFMQNGSTFDNQGSYTMAAGMSIVNNGGPLSSFVNSGAFNVAAGQAGNVGGIAFVNNAGSINVGAGATLTFGGGNTIFNSGTSFTGGGSTLITNNARFVDDFSSQNLRLANGFFSGGDGSAGSKVVVSGTVDFAGGLISGNWELANGQTFNGVAGINKFLSSAQFVNKGNLRWQATDSLFLQNGSVLDNQQVFDIQESMSIVNNGGPLSTLTNNNLLRVAAGKTVNVGSIGFVNNGVLDVAGTLNFGGGNATFNNGSTFSGAGTVAVNNNATFNGNQTSNNVSLRNGLFTGNGAVIHGSVEFTGGLLQGDWTVAAGQTLVGRDGNNKFLNVVTLTNDGNILWQTGNSLFMQNGAVIDNRGLYDMQTGAAIVNNGGPLSSFVNSGLLRVAAGQNSTIGSIAFVSNGGSVDVGAGGSMTFAGGNAQFNPGTQFSGAGVNLVTNNASFNGNFGSTNLSLRNGTFTGSGAVLNGSAEYSGGLLQGSWTVAGGATLKGVDGVNKFLNAVTLTNQGTIAWQTGNTLFFQNGAVINNQGTLDLQADSAMVFNGGPAGSFVNTGLIVKTGGAGTSSIGNNLGFDNRGVVDVESGTIRLPDNFTNNGTLKGIGSFTTNVLTNAGHVAPGSSPGTLTLNGNYLQTAAGFLDTELASAAQFDTFLINGTASLNGTLALSCVLACDLHDGDVFVILDSTGDLAGTFANVTTANFGNGFVYDVIYDYGADLVKLAVIHAGTFNPPPVPEPETWAMLAAGLGVIGALARRRRAQR